MPKYKNIQPFILSVATKGYSLNITPDEFGRAVIFTLTHMATGITSFMKITNEVIQDHEAPYMLDMLAELEEHVDKSVANPSDKYMVIHK